MKKPFGSNKPRSGSSDERNFRGNKPSFKPRKKFGDDQKPHWEKKVGGNERRSDDSRSSEKSSFGRNPRGNSDRPAWNSDRPGGDKKPFRSSSDERRPYGDKPKWNSDKPSWNSDRSGGDKKPYRSSSDERRPYGDKPKWNSDKPSWNSDRSGGDKKPFRSSSDERRPYGDKPKPKWNSDKPAWKSDRHGDEKKPYRSSSDEQRPYNDKPSWKSDKPDWKKDRSSQSGDRPAWKSENKSNWNSDRPAKKPDWNSVRPAWKSEDSGTDEGASRGSISVPYNKKNREEGSSQPDYPSKRPTMQSRPDYNPRTDAKSLIVTLEDTNNVPVRLIWIYESMVGDLPDGIPAAGDTVYVYDHNNRFSGSAIYNPNSKIRARIFSLVRCKFDEDYLREAIKKAITTRRELGLLDESCRAISGEGDGIPGLIADKIGDYLVIQPLTYAVNRYLSFIIDQLNSHLAPAGIVVRTDVPIRAKEGLSVEPPTIHGEVPDRVEIIEEGCKLFANPAGGQKTGLFLDQRLNRRSLLPFSKDARVLDLFCHVGGWAIRAAKYGAAEVIGVDSSEPALELARAGAAANGFDNVSFVADDVFEYLRGLDSEPESLFDIIVCDPPAFAKTRSHYEEAFRAYLSLNYLVMKKLKPGGVLITCSCSQAVSPMEFNEALLTASRNARMQFQVLGRRGAPQDHPALLGLPESEYLKCFVLRRIE